MWPMHHEADGAAFSIQQLDDYGKGLVFEFDDFDGDFFSLAFALPTAGVKGLRNEDLLRIVIQSEVSEPFQAYARLNLCHGPNTETVVRMIEFGGGESFAEFDVFYTGYEQKRATSAWIDLIINAPAHKRIVLAEVVILRRARANL